MCFSTEQGRKFCDRVQQQQQQEQHAGGIYGHMHAHGHGHAKAAESTREQTQQGEDRALVPTIDARKAQASIEEDRIRIFEEIERTEGIDDFNARLQEFMEVALQEEARAALVAARGGR